MSGGTEIRCKKCGKLLAKQVGALVEVTNGGKGVRAYGAVVVAIDCARCGYTQDIPAIEKTGGKDE